MWTIDLLIWLFFCFQEAENSYTVQFCWWSLFPCCCWNPDCPIRHVNKANVTTKINIFLSSLSDKIEDELEMATVCHRPEGLEQLEAQTNFTKRELQVLYRGFKNVRTIQSLVCMSPPAATAQLHFVSFPRWTLALLCLISPTTVKWTQSASPSNIYDTLICLKLGLDEYSAHNILIKFVPQMSVCTLQFPQLC